jgi:hypothetical protein
MQRTSLSFAAAVALAAATIGPVSAQTIPSGSYQQSCTNIRVRGDQLIARCNAPQGGTVRSTLSLDSCRGGDIANTNGQLTCNTNGYGRRHRNRNGNDNNGYGNNGYNNNNGYGNNGYNNNGYGNNGYNNNGYGNNGYGAVPGGSYTSSCAGAQMRGAVLSATCTAPNGARITSTINVNQCRGADIANIDGRLVCR